MRLECADAELITKRRPSRSASLRAFHRLLGRCDGGGLDVRSRCLRRDFVGMVLTSRDEVTILRERDFDQLIDDMIDGVLDEPRVEHERVTIRFLPPTDVATHGSDLVWAL